jgi:DNA-binding IclR family transcriptional regulator
VQISEIVGGTSKNISNMLTTMSQYGFVEKGSKRGLWKIATSQEEFDFE